MVEVLWIDGPDGNVEHLAEHGVTQAEAEDILRNPIGHDISRSTSRPIAIGYTRAGRRLIVVYEQIDDVTVYPITAFEPQQRQDHEASQDDT